SVVYERAVHEIEPPARVWKVHADVRQHPRILRAFPREEECDFSLARERLLEKVDSASVPDAPATRSGELLASLCDARAKIADRRRDDRQAAAVLQGCPGGYTVR